MAVLESSVREVKMEKKAKHKKKVDKGELLLKQEIKLAKALAGNDKKIRDRALKRLKKWLQRRSALVPFTEEDFMRLWKGLFYSLWMSDKLLVQEECAENVAQLMLLQDTTAALTFFKCGLVTLINEWFGIDQLRLDKFLMFTRRFLRRGFEILKNARWKRKVIEKFCAVLSETVLNARLNPPLGLVMHFTEIYFEELAKVSEGRLHESAVVWFLEPFVGQLCVSDDHRQSEHIVKYVFRYLMKQSEKGLEYEAKYDAWKKTGFRGGSIDCMVREPATDNSDASNADEEDENSGSRVLDPRAGHVDVELPTLKFRAREVAELLTRHKSNPAATTRGQKALVKLAHEFNQLAHGKYPLGVKKMVVASDTKTNTKLRQSVNRLMKFEEKLMGNGKKTKKRKAKVAEEVPSKKIKLDEIPAADFFQNKLETFVSQQKLVPQQKLVLKRKKRKPTTLAQEKIDECEYTFRRNSGTWYVFNEDANEATPVADKVNGVDSPSTSTRKRKKAVPEAAGFVTNPFSTPSSSGKKVKINMKLNMSQEFHEHHAKVLSSPVIPFDANKKPAKPLLKPSPVVTPINPFYKRKLKL